MIKSVFASLACTSLIASAALADEALLAREDVRQFLDQFSASHQYDRKQLDALFLQVTPQPQILELFDRPATGKPWYEFKDKFLQSQRVLAGARFWRENAELVEQISAHYQVDPEVILAILNVETGFGRNQGRLRVLDVLTTVAFDYPRRAEFFRRELGEFLLLARAEDSDPLQFKGSYAGAMGWPQFMPSSFRTYAQDWDKDGHHDIWNNPADALASTANYLKAFGWQYGQPAYAPTLFRGDASALLAEKFNLKYTLGELMQRGVEPLESQDSQAKAVLFTLETEPGLHRYHLGYSNFYAITRYNKSTHYATAVVELAGQIRAAYQDGADLKAAQAKPAGKAAAPRPVRSSPAEARPAKPKKKQV